ncbi:MAG: tRNA threonylcarbamoyladenosine biosynthesis protein TsaE [Bacteriovoracaceae bacterium]|jgi:tRNA threonylcarbamoyladenosine biosynthesis protein TsaE
MKLLREWKKVFESDLESILIELKDTIEVPAVIILSGEMGVGKTTFTKAFALSEVDDPSTVQSPTYSIINETGSIVHADFYRLNDSSEIIHLELPLYLEDKEFFLVEWGKAHLEELRKHIDDDFFFYEIIISANINKDNSDNNLNVSRNYSLFDLKEN